MSAPLFSVKFWGVRGSLPAATASHVGVGGNTSCVEMRCGDRVLIFDAGTGAHPAGQALKQEGISDLDLFFSHSHYDHILGLPFFAPLHNPNGKVRLWAGHLAGEMSCEQMVKEFMRPPFFPVGPSCMSAAMDFRDFQPGDTLDIGDGIVIRTMRLNHPGGAVAYRVNFDDRAICYVTDTEHVGEVLDPAILAFINDADIVIYDATYTDEELPHYLGYGHSTWQHGAKLCAAANVGKYVIFHHRLEHDDETLDQIEVAARNAFSGSVLAREGLRLEAG
jgi:phosphoribosyl 1,2-cyclic phosphodiesterase